MIRKSSAKRKLISLDSLDSFRLAEAPRKEEGELTVKEVAAVVVADERSNGIVETTAANYVTSAVESFGIPGPAILSNKQIRLRRGGKFRIP